MQSPPAVTAPTATIHRHDGSNAASQPDPAEPIVSFLRGYADERLNSRLIDERRGLPPSVVLELGKAGLLGLQVEREYGGRQLGHRDTFRVIEQVAAIDPNLTLLVAVHNAIGITPVRHFADRARKAEVLPVLARGAGLATIAASEPGAGSDLRAIATTARQLPDGGYLLNGDKSWISLGSWAGHVTVFAQLEAADGRPLGITGFLVEAGTPGFIPGEEILTLGMKGIPQNHIAIRDLRLPPGALLGAEGQGLAVAQSAFMAGRAFVGAVSLGAMKRCLQLAHRYASRRTVATGGLFDNGRTQQILSGNVAATHAVDALMGHMAGVLDRGAHLPDELYFAAKIMGSELMWRVVDSSVQMLGARGYLDTNIVGQYFRDYRLLRIFEGATEAVTVYLGSTVLKDPDGFCAMLAAQFGGSTAVDAVSRCLARLRVNRRGVDLSDQRNHHVLANAVGELAGWAVLAAVTASAGGRDVDTLTAEWCRERLYDTIRTTEQDPRPSELFPSDTISREITGYADVIGDTEQTLPGEASHLDSLLAR
ncbi:alkylation response protein AidB-like acyl-CoA dehydrogenase [Saccharothrix ecbatanensis]|uniref:Alkylation response protein AidB-like acyl-CoA dehydrogenase n=1 Tax=Saccharothrix ecbatanensis TaxID=1105145 RepID=A0A7W9HF33_9PSEU|nr:acyl-CoA dehydrogenase family protein [Saccharothrix ecbatanensis]MBB5801030.1 alkylation response protein AidB-like acyl-CoA dehydrogenase [Saccharothrix ecbatanensis]